MVSGLVPGVHDIISSGILTPWIKTWKYILVYTLAIGPYTMPYDMSTCLGTSHYILVYDFPESIYLFILVYTSIWFPRKYILVYTSLWYITVYDGLWQYIVVYDGIWCSRKVYASTYTVYDCLSNVCRPIYQDIPACRLTQWFVSCCTRPAGPPESCEFAAATGLHSSSSTIVFIHSRFNHDLLPPPSPPHGLPRADAGLSAQPAQRRLQWLLQLLSPGELAGASPPSGLGSWQRLPAAQWSGQRRCLGRIGTWKLTPVIDRLRPPSWGCPRNLREQ